MNIKPKTARIIITTFALWAIAAWIAVHGKQPSAIRDIIAFGFGYAALVAIALIWPAVIADAVLNRNKLEILFQVVAAVITIWIVAQYWHQWSSRSKPPWIAIFPAVGIAGGIGLIARLLAKLIQRIAKFRQHG